MNCNCENKALKLFRGYSSIFADTDWLSIIFESEPIDLTNFEAKFALGDITREWGDITQGIIINLTDEETGTLPIGLNYGSLIVTDKDGNSKPFSTAIPIEVLDWVEGDQEIDTYNMTVNALLDNEVQMVIKIETAKVSLDWVNERIAEHNISENAHQYIQGLVSDEATARQNADNLLGQRITENTQRFNDYRTKSQQDVIDVGLRREIVDVNSNFSNYRTASAQDIIDNAQNYEISGKQDKLNTEQMKAVNSGITDIKVSSYDSHIANTVIHVTAQDKQVWNAKQNALNQQQLDAVNSGITDGYVEQITLNKNNISSETTNRQLADNNLQQQIDAITAASDVTDVVGTYAQLQAYDTSHLPNNSIIKVLQDESRDNETTYYRWVITGGVGSWVLIGEEGPYYTKSEANSTFVPQTRTVNGKALSSNISLDANDVGAVSSNQSITGATKCKITYDSKGLVTAGADLSSSDVTTALGYTPPTINTTNNYVPYRSNATAFSNSTLMYNSSAMAFTGKLHIGSSSPSTYSNFGRLTLYDNTPSQQVSSIALLNYGGGGGCGVAIDMYNTNANGGIPSGRFGVVDNGNYSGYLQLQVKKSGGPNNPLLPAMNIVPVPASNSLTTCVSFGQDEFNRVLFDLHRPEATTTITDSDKRWTGSGTTYYVSGSNKFNQRLLVAIGDIVSFDSFTTEATVVGIVSNSTTLQITTDKTLGSVSGANISVKKAYLKITDENNNTKIYVNPDGKMGLNTLLPEYTLDVNGTINASTDVKVNGNSVLTYAGTFYWGE